MRSSYAFDPNTDIPNAGYAQLGESTFYVVNSNDLLSLYLNQSTTSNPLSANNTVWQFITDNGEWMMWIAAVALSQVSYTIQSPTFGQPTTIVTYEPHGLLNGDICIIFGVGNVPEINDTYVINSVTPTTFNINLSTFANGTGGTIWVYRPMRFANLFARDTSAPPGGYMNGNLVYVDDGGVVPNAWTVYRYINNKFVAYRQQPLQVDPNLLQSSEIYNLNTGANLASLEYWDPAKGRIPGQAQQELNYITDVDPATYNSGSTTGYLVDATLSWSSTQLGQTWWDVSQVRYVDYEQGDESYRINTWGQIAPGTNIVVYEWIQTSIPPTEWATAVASGTPILINGNFSVPNGVVKTTFNWSQIVQYNSQNVATTYYYFWVGNSGLPPAGLNRKLSTQGIATLIKYPSQANVPWYAAISSNSIILGNVQSLLNGLRVSQRINYTSKANNANIYSQWELIREGDPASPINPIVWSRLKASLATFDGLGNDVPDYRLNAYNKYGTFIRPRQTWFENREAASALFVNTFNSLIAASTTPFVYDATKTGWLNYFDAAEPLPQQYTSLTFNVIGTVSSYINTISTAGLSINDQVQFDKSFGGLIAYTSYYVSDIINETQFTVSPTYGGASVNLSTSKTYNTVAINLSSTSATPLQWTVGLNNLYIPNHPFYTGQLVTVSSTGTLPAPLSANTVYYVIYIDSNYIQLASNYTNAEAIPPVAVTLTSSGSGVFDIYSYNNLAYVLDSSVGYVSVTTTLGMVPNRPIIFDKSIGGLQSGKTYYVQSILDQTSFTVCIIPGGQSIILSNSTISAMAVETITNWDYQVADLTQRDGLIGAVLPGQLILVEANNSTTNLWTIWEYTPQSFETWTLKQIQAYNTANYWQYVNWYAAGYSNTTPPNYSVQTIAELDLIKNPTAGQFVQVVNGGDGNWQWYSYLGGSWVLVAQQNGSIEVLPSIYQWAKYFGGFDGAPFDSAGTGSVFNPTPSFDDNASTEFAHVIDGIYNVIYPGPNSIELNTLFFAMTNYVVSEQLQVDWIFKTSNMVFTGFNQTLGQSPLLAVDNTQSILAFINEAKPYHAQIQNYTNGYSALNQANVSVVDFDVPYSYLTAGTPNTVVNSSNIAVASSNLEGTEYYETYNAWYKNYQPASSVAVQHYIDPSLVRNLSTKIIFDRISTPALVLGWSKTGWSTLGWSSENTNENYGAQTRIEQYYAPTAGMIPNVISDLMQGVVYKGQTIGNLGFQTEPGWSMGPWGGLLGWDADTSVVNAYLDQIIQGGQIPNYDSAIGNGQTVSFPLSRGAQNPNNIVVWSDGDLRLYGVNWIVPTFATNAYVVNSGSGYAIGDQITLLAGTSVVPVRLQVTSVNNGSITGITILGKGSYSTVTPGPYSAVYPPFYPGNGVNAQIGIDWDCSSIQFYAAPSSSATPNIFILYVGTTFESAPTNASDSIYDGYQFVQPYVDDNHPEELYSMRARDCLTMSTYSVQVGGRPAVVQRVYTTDGVTDQFDLAITPQSDQAVMAYLDNQPLTVGTNGNVVINYSTNRLVFIDNPSAGHTLYITSIGFGGTGRSVANAYVVSGGSGYNVGDLITLSAGMSLDSPILTVSNTSVQGAVVATTVNNPGLYPQLPVQPVSQSTTSGSGIGAKFNLAFTDGFKRFDYVGDGSNTVFPLPGTVPNVSGVMVNVNGIIVGYQGWQTTPVTAIVLNSAPPYGSSVVIATFDAADFSQVQETVISVTDPSILTYAIPSANSTRPQYVSTLVRQNGQLMTPPIMQTFTGNNSQTHFTITVDLSDSLEIQVYVDSSLQISNTDYNITGSTLVFAVAPIDQADIVLINITATTVYTLSNTSITFNTGTIQTNDQIIVTTYTQDIDYQFRTEEFTANVTGIYALADYPTDFNTMHVWLANNLLTAEKDFTVIESSDPKVISVHIPPTGDYTQQIVVTYMTGRPQAPAIAWRTTTGWDATLSTALDPARETRLLSNVYTYSSTVEIEDITTITQPSIGIPGLVYINDELISFTTIHMAPTATYPNRAFLAGLARDRLGTSGSPETIYNTDWYDGNAVKVYFATESATQAISTSVFVGGRIQVENIDYTIVNNPNDQPAGSYVKFTTAPPVGVKNVQITALNQISYKTQLSHVSGSTVIDAGTQVQIPGGYQWVSTPNGLQYSDSHLAIFLLEHSGS